MLAKLLDRVDALSEFLGIAAAWMYFVTGIVIGYEVSARYLFNSPTIWAQEVAQLLLLWATFLAISRALKRRQHIRVALFDRHLSTRTRQALDVFVLVFIAVLCALVIWFGSEIFWDSFVRGRSTGTMLNIPNWWSEVVIPVGFGILLLQALVEMVRLWRRERSV
jgi:TRAP-type C4-dicarboxylate transport system permease small subunit